MFMVILDEVTQQRRCARQSVSSVHLVDDRGPAIVTALSV